MLPRAVARRSGRFARSRDRGAGRPAAPRVRHDRVRRARTDRAGRRRHAAHDPAYLRAAREICDRHDVFLSSDEVFTGYGRTGPMWACEHAGIRRICSAPRRVSRAGCCRWRRRSRRRASIDGFLGGRERAFYYGHSFCGNPLGAAVALEVLRVYEEEHVLERAAPKAARIADAFAKLGALPGVTRTRALGMIGALDLAGGDGYLADIGWRVYAEALRARRLPAAARQRDLRGAADQHRRRRSRRIARHRFRKRRRRAGRRARYEMIHRLLAAAFVVV